MNVEQIGFIEETLNSYIKLTSIPKEEDERVLFSS